MDSGQQQPVPGIALRAGRRAGQYVRHLHCWALLLALLCAGCQTTPSGQAPLPTTDPATWPAMPVPTGFAAAAPPDALVRIYRMRIQAVPRSGTRDYQRIGLAAYVGVEAPTAERAQLNEVLRERRLPQSYVDSVDLYLAEGWSYALSVALPDERLVHIIGLSQAQAAAYGATTVPDGGTMLLYVIYQAVA